MTTPDWMYRSLLGNSLRDWTVATGSALLVMAAVLLLRRLVLRRLGTVAPRTGTLVDDALVEIAYRDRRAALAELPHDRVVPERLLVGVDQPREVPRDCRAAAPGRAGVRGKALE